MTKTLSAPTVFSFPIRIVPPGNRPSGKARGGQVTTRRTVTTAVVLPHEREALSRIPQFYLPWGGKINTLREAVENLPQCASTDRFLVTRDNQHPVALGLIRLQRDAALLMGMHVKPELSQRQEGRHVFGLGTGLLTACLRLAQASAPGLPFKVEPTSQSEGFCQHLLEDVPSVRRLGRYYFLEPASRDAAIEKFSASA